MNSDVKSSREAKSLIHCLRFVRGATPQTPYKKKTGYKMTKGTGKNFHFGYVTTQL